MHTCTHAHPKPCALGSLQSKASEICLNSSKNAWERKGGRVLKTSCGAMEWGSPSLGFCAQCNLHKTDGGRVETHTAAFDKSLKKSWQDVSRRVFFKQKGKVWVQGAVRHQVPHIIIIVIVKKYGISDDFKFSINHQSAKKKNDDAGIWASFFKVKFNQQEWNVSPQIQWTCTHNVCCSVVFFNSCWNHWSFKSFESRVENTTKAALCSEIRDQISVNTEAGACLAGI